MFTLIKWVAVAGAIVWVATTYGPILGLTANEVQQINATVDKATGAVTTPEQKAQAEAALKQVAPSPEQIQAKVDQILPVALENIHQGAAALREEATKLHDGMNQP